MIKRRTLGNKGFTIIELMIATLVFSVVLLIITAGVISLTNQYYKGMTSSNTQSVTRSAMDTITQDIQFSSIVDPSRMVVKTSASDPSIKFFCTATHIYTFRPGKQLADSPNSAQSNKALVQSTITGNCPGASGVSGFPPSSANPRELLSPGMRVSNLAISPAADASGSWAVKLRIASGEDDLLSGATGTTPLCKGESGGQFCAVSELTTTVESRL